MKDPKVHNIMQYRREIDGLRAVAVLPVILFHAGFEVFSGGYVGVDVFFVISGYLITSILISDLERGDFSIVRFYERRARRILPALFTVMFACIPFAYLWMLPSQLKDFAQSLVAVVFFASNILFWREEGYFEAAAELKPLLHTWSLAVEEQYYLLFPVLLFLLWRLGQRRVFWIVSWVAILSLLLSEWAWRNQPSANFFLAPTRAWELLAGSICAFLAHGKVQRSSGLLSAIGLGLIVSSIFIYDHSTPFPSVYALIPVVGTALVILFAAKGTWVARLLASRGLVGIGLISYSAYLWHQPLFAFARLRSITEPGPVLMAALAVLSIGLAWGTWHWVEQPFRRRANLLLATRRNLFAASGAGALAFTLVGAAGHVGDGFSWRSSGSVTLAELERRIARNHGLHPDCESEFKTSKNCYTSSEPTVLLWGDSYAMHLTQGIIFSDERVSLQQHTKSACAPVLGISVLAGVITETRAEDCISFNNRVLRWLHKQKSVDMVILSSPFAALLDGPVLLDGGEIISEPDPDALVEIIKSTVEAIRQTGARVLIVSPPPGSGIDNGQCLTRSVFFGADESVCDFLLETESDVASLLGSLSNTVPVYWLHEDLCTKGLCDVMQDGVFLYRDGGHLSREGSEYLGREHSWMTRFQNLAE